MTIREEMNELRDIMKALAATAVKHDDQIEGLLQIAEKQQARLRELAETVAATERQWQAYLRTLPRQRTSAINRL